MYVLKMAGKDIENLIKYCAENGRICPDPDSWNLLWKKLKNKKQKPSGGWVPSLPLILAAWWNTSTEQKKERFHEHLKWAEDHGQLEEITNFVLELNEDDWFHEKD